MQRPLEERDVQQKSTEYRKSDFLHLLAILLSETRQNLYFLEGLSFLDLSDDLRSAYNANSKIILRKKPKTYTTF